MGAALFESMAPDEIRQSVARARASIEGARAERVRKIESFYANGPDVREQFLHRYPGDSLNPKGAEDDLSYAWRKRRTAVPNYVGRIADTLIDAVWGDPIELKLDAKDEKSSKADAANEAIERVLRWNKFGASQRAHGYGQVVCGDHWVRVQFVEDMGVRSIGLPPVHTLNVIPQYHPANPRLLILAEEEVDHPTQAGKKAYWRWTREWFEVVDENGNYIELDLGWTVIRGRTPNPYRTIPLVRIPGRLQLNGNYGLSYLEDAVDLQEMLLQWMSELDQLTYKQVHALLFTSGMVKAEIAFGPGTHLNCENVQGTAQYIAPNAAHSDVRENIKLLVEALTDTTSVPLSTMRGGGIASSGYQAELEMAPTARVVDAIRDDAVDGLQDMLRMIVIVGAYHKVEGLAGLSPDAFNPVVTITGSILPRDEALEREKDLNEVDAGMRLPEDYVRDWVLPEGADDKQVAEYMAKLGEKAQAKQDALAAEFDAKFRSPGGELMGQPDVPPKQADGQTPPAGEDVAKTALNGAQVTALQGMLAAVADGTLVPEAAMIAISEAFPSISEARVRAMVEAQQEAVSEPQGQPQEQPRGGDNVPPQEQVFQ